MAHTVAAVDPVTTARSESFPPSARGQSMCNCCCICEILLIFYDFCGRALYTTLLLHCVYVCALSPSLSVRPLLLRFEPVQNISLVPVFVFYLFLFDFVNFLWSPGPAGLSEWCCGFRLWVRFRFWAILWRKCHKIKENIYVYLQHCAAIKQTRSK